MLNEILLGGFIATISGLFGFFISKKITYANFDVLVDKAKAKASAIENEAQLLLHKSNVKAQDIEREAIKYYEGSKERAKADLHQREDDVIRKEQSFIRYKQLEDKRLREESRALEVRKLDIQRNEKSLESLKHKYEAKIDESSSYDRA